MSAADDVDTSVLEAREVFWRDHQEWLQERDYMLRPRYRVGWTPEWKGRDVSPYEFEDGAPMARGHVLDATRISTGEIVMLKRISKVNHPTELAITQYFCQEPLASHPKNHCVPLEEVLELPDDSNLVILVFPLLRSLNSPPMETVGEAVEFFRQIFEGMQFIHQCHVAHRDCMDRNIMMDPRNMFPQSFHPRFPTRSVEWHGKPQYYSRTARPPKYYIIDFGLSLQFDPNDGPPLASPIRGGDKSVPEFQDPSGWYDRDPFPTDVYYIGNLIRKGFLQKVHGLEFMKPLVDEMVQDDPTKRPTMDDVVQKFEEVFKTLSWWSFSRRLVPDDDDSSSPLFASVGHIFRTAFNVLALRNPLPTPKS